MDFNVEKSLKKQLEEGGFTREDESRWGGALDRVPSGEGWHVPPYELTTTANGGAAVGWDPHGSGGGWARDDGQLFDRLVDLSKDQEASPDEVLRFAQRYGLPEMCGAHGVPCRRLPVVHCLADHAGDECELWNPLPVEAVLKLSREVRSLLTVRLALEDDEKGDGEDWRRLLRADPKLSEKRLDLFYDKEGPKSLRTHLSRHVNRWLDYGDVRVRVAAGDRGFNANTDSFRPGLVGAVARHLFMTVCGEPGIALCSDCGGTYHPDRKPPKGRDNYCPPCRNEGGGYRASKRRSARRNR